MRNFHALKNQLHTYFKDLYLNDHNAETGLRISRQSRYLSSDNARRNLHHLPEPSASRYTGPFAQQNTYLEAKVHHHNMEDRQKHGYVSPQKINPGSITWGTLRWRKDQAATTARFDYILTPNSSHLDGLAEIRRVVVPTEA